MADPWVLEHGQGLASVVSDPVALLGSLAVIFSLIRVWVSAGDP